MLRTQTFPFQPQCMRADPRDELLAASRERPRTAPGVVPRQPSGTDGFVAQACFPGNKSLISGRLARSPWTCPSPQNYVRDESVMPLHSERCHTSAGSPWLPGPKCFHRYFSTCNRQVFPRWNNEENTGLLLTACECMWSNASPIFLTCGSGINGISAWY